LRLSGVSKILSGPPFRAQLSGLDLNGDGTLNDLLPGTGWNELNRRQDTDDLRRLVDQFNSDFAGARTATGQLISPVVLPANFGFGDTVFSQDFRVARLFRLSEQYELNVFGEVFNLFNVANLDGYGVNLADRTAFGQPNRRVNQVFGSGGPRAFQLGIRLGF
jgi:hypothetical protein